MLFVNKSDETKQIRIKEKNGYRWKILEKGDEIELDKETGDNNGLKLKVVEAKVGNVNIETKTRETKKTNKKKKSKNMEM